jgi:colicin import membrane protein
MAPKKKAPPRELTEEDMRRMQMSEEQIQTILAERSKSKEEKLADRAAGDKARTEREAKERKQKQDADAAAKERELQEAAEATRRLEEEIRREAEEAEAAKEREHEARIAAEAQHKAKLEAIRAQREKDLHEFQSRLKSMTEEERIKELADIEAKTHAAEADLQEQQIEEIERHQDTDRKRAAREERAAARLKEDAKVQSMLKELAAQGIVVDGAETEEKRTAKDDAHDAIRRNLVGYE